MTSIGFFRLKLRSGIAIVASGAKNAIMKEIINPFPVILKILKSIGARFTANFSWISVEAVSLSDKSNNFRKIVEPIEDIMNATILTRRI